MSYLNPLRLHFFGQFQAAVSTVNNDPTHFNNATFQPSYQERQKGWQPNGWWNPRGDANWRMIGCNITSAWLANGEPAAKSDPVLTYLIADSDDTVAAKLVDLDSEQQGVSEIWGMRIRIADSQGNTLLSSKYETVGLMDIFKRWPGGAGDSSACAMYQSVLTDIQWGPIENSPFLQQLRTACTDGLLSIKFNVDAYDANFQSPTFTLGRIAGTIGPAKATEPKHFVNGRHFMTAGLPSQSFFIPAGGVNFCEAVVDEQAGKIYLDLGNSLTTTTMGGSFTDIGFLSLACSTADSAGEPETLFIGNVNYQAPGWYQQTAGVAVVPWDRRLTPEELKNIASNPLAIILTEMNSNMNQAISEPSNGLYVRPDQFVYRLNPGESAEIHLFGTQFGQPCAGARVFAFLDPTQIGGGPGTPPVGVPEDTLDFPHTFLLDSKGEAKVKVRAGNPGNPREYIDGQVYSIRFALAGTLPPPIQYAFNPSEFVSFLVWDEFTTNPPVWYGCLQPVFQQYANLYPIMSRFLNLASYESICANLIPLSITFGLDATDPNAMPVTRDLSGGKRAAILKWLKNVGPDGKPLLGPVPAEQSPAPAPETKTAAVPAPLTNSGKLAFFTQLRAGKRAARKR
jgi:hypothetical protein